MKRIMYLIVAGLATVSMLACNNAEKADETAKEKTEMEMLVDNYAEVELTAI